MFHLQKGNILIYSSLAFILSFLVFAHSANAQEVKVQLGPGEIALNQPFTITVTIQNENLRSINDFPDIPGFSKANISSSSTTNYINGRMSSSQSRTLNYIPQKEGTFKLLPFSVEVNGKRITSPGKTIKVGPPAKRQRRSFFDNDPTDDFFGRPNKKQEFIDVEADAFLALTTDRSEVFQGEGFTATLAFYVSAKNRADMRFYELGKQITEITSKIKPSNCWEESFNIDNITGEPITINNERFTQYKVYQATFYPWNTETIKFPSVELELIKYKVAKSPSFFGRNKQEDFQTFKSKPRNVTVKELPPHPLKELVAVGIYNLKENIDKTTLNTGESFNYKFDITGFGNINAIEDPIIPKDLEDFDIYDPNKQININRGGNRVSGTKSFNYYGIPKEPGTYNLGDIFSWIYFDPRKEVYDTLKSELQIVVNGESRKNESIIASDMGNFYDKIDIIDNSLTSYDPWLDNKMVSNFLLALVLIGCGAILFKGYQKPVKADTSNSLLKRKTKVTPEKKAVTDLTIIERLIESSFIRAFGWGIVLVLVSMSVEWLATLLESALLVNLYSIIFILAVPVIFYLFTKSVHSEEQSFIDIALHYLLIIGPILLYLTLFDGIALSNDSLNPNDVYFGFFNNITSQSFIIILAVIIVSGVAFWTSQRSNSELKA